MKKVLNICSYLLNIFFIAIFAIGYFNTWTDRDLRSASDDIKAAEINLEDELFSYGNSSKEKASYTQKEKTSYIQDCIVEREKADIPLKIQRFEKVYGITIDNFVLTNNVEPYTGYLVTTWDLDEKQDLSAQQWAANGYKDKYIRKQKTVYVEISDITLDREGRVSWSDSSLNWFEAYTNVRKSE